MTLAKLKASPFGVGDELTSVEMNILNDEIANALDIINGGVYVSLAPVSTDTTWTFAGAGNTVVFASSVFWSNGATFNGAAEFNSTLALNGVTTVTTGAVVAFANGSSMTGAAGATITWTGNVTFKGNVFFDTGTSLAIFKNGATFNTGGSVSVSVPWAFASGSTVDLAVTMTPTGSGHILKRIVAAGDAAGLSYGINDGDIVYRAGAHTAARTTTINSTGATAGAWLRVRKTALDGFDWTLIRDDTTQICVISGAAIGTGTGKFAQWVDLMFTGGNWQIVGGQLNP